MMRKVLLGALAAGLEEAHQLPDPSFRWMRADWCIGCLPELGDVRVPKGTGTLLRLTSASIPPCLSQMFDQDLRGNSHQEESARNREAGRRDPPQQYAGAAPRQYRPGQKDEHSGEPEACRGEHEW